MLSAFSPINYVGGKISQFTKLCRLPHFMSIAKRIPDERSQKTVTDAFDVLCRTKSFEMLSSYLPPNLKSLKASDVDTTQWKDVQMSVDWCRKPQ